MIEFNPKLFSPLYWHLKPLLRDPAIRYIFVEGGSSAAKTFTICQALSLDMLEYGYSSIVFRRFGVDISDSIYSSFKAAQRSLELTPFWIWQQHLMKSGIGQSRIRFRGLDDEENIKGIEDFNVVYNNEWSQFTEDQFSQQRKRLRGKPNQKFICDWNPISSKLWQYEKWIDLDTWIDQPLDIEAPASFSALDSGFSFKKINETGDAVWLKTTYRDNFWIVGHPSGKGGYRDEHTLADFEKDRIQKPNLYRIYANGERGVIRTGGEFLKQFDEMKHVKAVNYHPAPPLQVTIDNNVNPYVTIGIHQLIGKELTQIDELPCKTPFNNAPKAAGKLADWLDRKAYDDVVFIHGDPSANARSTVDEEGRSFFQKFIDTLQKRGYKVTSKVMSSAPAVALSGAFMNEILEHGYDGYTLAVSDRCKTAIDDYATTKEAPDGTMAKIKVKDQATGVTYEPNGHYTDTWRYLVVGMLNKQYLAFKARKKTNLAALAGHFA